MPVQETTIQGTGTLKVNSGADLAVSYTLTIRTSIVTQPGFPPAAGQAQGRGRISAADGTRLPEGIYHLTTADGQRLRVQNLMGTWHILSPIP